DSCQRGQSLATVSGVEQILDPHDAVDPIDPPNLTGERMQIVNERLVDRVHRIEADAPERFDAATRLRADYREAEAARRETRVHDPGRMPGEQSGGELALQGDRVAQPHRSNVAGRLVGAMHAIGREELD